jgi:hypothetical protein
MKYHWRYSSYEHICYVDKNDENIHRTNIYYMCFVNYKIVLLKYYQIIDVDFSVRSWNECLEISVAEHPKPVQVDHVGQTLSAKSKMLNCIRNDIFVKKN